MKKLSLISMPFLALALSAASLSPAYAGINCGWAAKEGKFVKSEYVQVFMFGINPAHTECGFSITQSGKTENASIDIPPGTQDPQTFCTTQSAPSSAIDICINGSKAQPNGLIPDGYSLYYVMN